MKRVLYSLSVLTIGLASCSGQTTPQADKPFDLLESAVLVQPAVAQGQTVFNQFSRGLTTQAAKNLNISSILVEDFEGKPFTYINFTTADKIGDPWAYAIKIGNQARQENTSYAESTVVTGASTGRSIGMAMTNDLELVKMLGRTIIKVGGKQNVKRLVSLNGLWDVYLEDKNGTFWRVGDQTVMSDREVNDAKKMYGEVRARNNDPKLKEVLDKEWGKILPKQSSGGPSVVAPQGLQATAAAGYVRADGNLDMSKVASSIEQRGGMRLPLEARGVRAKFMGNVTQDCWPFMWWQVCDPAWYGHLNRNKVPGGGWQEPSTFLSAPYSIPYMGCGPAAFISLAHWWNENEGVNWYNKPATGITPYYKTVASYWSTVSSLQTENYGKFASNSFAVLAGARQSSGLPSMSEYMGSFWFVNGTATTPQGFLDGGKNWLINQKNNFGVSSSLQLQGYFNVAAGVYIWGPAVSIGAVSNGLNAFNFAAAVRAETGYNDRPVIALYPTGRSNGLEAHYSPILRFHLIQGAAATVWVTPMENWAGSPNWEVNLGNVNNIFAGVFYFTR